MNTSDSSTSTPHTPIPLLPLPPPTKKIRIKRKNFDSDDTESLFSTVTNPTPENNSDIIQIKPMDEDMITLLDIIGCPRKEKKIMSQLGYLSTIQHTLLAKDKLKREKKLGIGTRALLLTFVNWREKSGINVIDEYEECMDDRENKQYHKSTMAALSAPMTKLMDSDDSVCIHDDSSTNQSQNSGIESHNSDSQEESYGSVLDDEDYGFICRG